MKTHLILGLILGLLGSSSVWSQAITVDSSGNVGVGTATPTVKLEVDGSVKANALVVGSSTILEEGAYVSADQTIPSSGVTLTLAHGLGGKPKFFTVSLKCVTADWGWVVGDEVTLSSIHMISNNYGLTTGVNTTHFKIIMFGSIYVHRLDATGGPVTINPARWKLVVRAWR